MKRSRSVANAMVGVAEYMGALREWRSSWLPNHTLEDMVGQKFIEDLGSKENMFQDK